MALKEIHGGAAWYDWERELVARDPQTIARWREKLADRILFYEFVQYAFYRQWTALREACARHDIHLIGDMPIFVAQDSADIWARPDLFQLDETGRPLVVAGVPPDYFSETGQLWGNPLYRWEAHAAEKFAWWIARLKASTNRVDLIRLDHFRGFEAYWEVPAGSETAATGRWALGPGTSFLEALREGLGGLPLIAEDLGKITAEVEALRDRFELPGMRILQFAFGAEGNSDYHLPHKYVHHCVVYTGTHDNDTTVGWFTGSAAETTQSREQIRAERAFVLRYLGTSGAEVHWDLIRVGFASVADTAIIPMQDVLGLDQSARMNVPGHAARELGLAIPGRPARSPGPRPAGGHDGGLRPLERDRPGQVRTPPADPGRGRVHRALSLAVPTGIDRTQPRTLLPSPSSPGPATSIATGRSRKIDPDVQDLPSLVGMGLDDTVRHQVAPATGMSGRGGRASCRPRTPGRGAAGTPRAPSSGRRGEGRPPGPSGPPIASRGPRRGADARPGRRPFDIPP